jgi:2-polyprenyl-3-methyl-5-hydroxy-6-metoxy-1,4-benzoquinol methylase
MTDLIRLFFFVIGRTNFNMDDHQSHFEANRESWNKRTAVHAASEFYDLDSFKKGRTSLNRVELDELGDVKGKSLLHLQCHFGMDTLSWAREGATVTGIDLSDGAIKLANELSVEINVPAKFICCNVYDAPKNLEGKFDIVFTSYGTIGWLPDLDKWAEIIAYFLKPGGVFYIVDFHPVLWMMDENFQHIKYNYFNTTVIAEENAGTYTNREAPIRSMEYSWNHPFSEIFTALIKNGLSVQQFHEFPFSPYNCFKCVEQGPDGMWRITGMDEKMPMLYSVKAVKLS